MNKTYVPLTDADVSKIAQAYYEERAAKTSPQREPVIVLVGAQPGAGKSRAATMIRAELAKRGGYIHIDADRMREEINTKGTKPSSRETQADAGKLVQALREKAIAGQRNILEEGTFRDSTLAAAFIEKMKQNGYRIEMVAVATPREASLLGIYQRYEYQHQTNARNPRFVDKAYHDAAMSGFEKNLSDNEKGFARVRVIDRDCQLLFDSDKQKAISAFATLKNAQPVEQKLAKGIHAFRSGFLGGVCIPSQKVSPKPQPSGWGMASLPP